MPRILTGTIVSVAMNNTIVVEITRHVPHPLYKKLMKRSKKHKVHVTDEKVNVGELVHIIETKPISKDKHFKLFTKNGGEKVTKAKTETVEATVATAVSKVTKKAVKKTKKEDSK